MQEQPFWTLSYPYLIWNADRNTIISWSKTEGYPANSLEHGVVIVFDF